MKRIIVNGSAENEYASSEEKLVIALIALKYPPVRIEADGVICTYYFDQDKVMCIVDKISCGSIQNIDIPLADLWTAQNVWKVNLSRARQGQ